MSPELQTQVKAAPKLSFTPASTGLPQRKCACGGSPVMDGECEECSKKRLTLQRYSINRAEPSKLVHSFIEPFNPDSRATVKPGFGHNFSRVRVHNHTPQKIQTKLAVNQPGDIYEQEADRIADQVMATPAHPVVSGAPRIQRFSRRSNEPLETAPASVDRALASPGRLLEPALRQDMEQRFGYDFSRVRVHSGAVAEQSAQDVNAHAYTVGYDIVFGEGQYSPRTLSGQQLLAHELAHTLQQAKGSAAGAERISDPRDPAEQEAERATSDAITGRLVDVTMAANPHTLHRQPLPDVTLRPPPLTARLMGSERLDGFALNSAELTEDHKWRLSILAHTLKSLLSAYPGGRVQITGHTDASGDEKFNERLGQQRADAVRDFLIEAGIPVAAMASLSAGESKLHIKTDRPEPRNRRAELRFETEPKGRFFPSLEPTLPDPPPEQKGIPSPERLCIVHPELEVCRAGLEPSPPRGLEVAPSCTSTECFALWTRPFDEQPPDLQRVLAASFKDPAAWFDKELDRDRRSALTSIYNRLCKLGLWCRVRRVLGVQAGEAPVSIWGVKIKVPGLTPSVDLLADDNKAILEALVSSSTSCVDMGLGGSLHAGQSSLREASTSESLHAAIGSRNLFDMHVDLYSSVTSRAGGVACRYDPAGTAAHLGREVFPEKLRGLVHWLTSWMNVGPLPIARDIARAATSGVQVFPDFELTPTVTRPEPATRPEAVPPPMMGITWRGPLEESKQSLAPAEAKRVSPDIGVLSEEVAERIRLALEEQVSPEALLPSQVRRRLTEARRAAEMAGPDEEVALRAARDAAENETAAYMDAHDVAFDLAVRMERARRSHMAWVKLNLPQYGVLDGNGRRAIVREIRRIALILRDYLPDRAAGVNTVVIIFGTGNLSVREETRLPGWVEREKGIFD